MSMPSAAMSMAKSDKGQAPYLRIVLAAAGNGRFASFMVEELAGKEGDCAKTSFDDNLATGLPFAPFV